MASFNNPRNKNSPLVTSSQYYHTGIVYITKLGSTEVLRFTMIWFS